ncbi:Putative DNA-binding domain-containing protein [Salinihabitans flavidus]|uniref:Putative DNA-binding domain-containing protein n=1 Tax=Salinihabitans flavidus TaxID=569882 RepID=A0A1H8R8T8_9RHOB|nr:DNA-binding domain-containing protein [Salinihabitans flavidus]SEO62766.1 Putative DNA-binding domain-containing protein [Salinihabitans flavidus]
MSVDQGSFRAALLDPERPVPGGLRDGAGRPAGRRFAVYRNNVAVSLTDALETGFPVVARLLGPTNFRSVAGAYLRQYPPRSPMMMTYGADFPGFLQGFEPLAHLGYLSDVAALEYALRESYHAADAGPIAPDALAAIPSDALAETRLTLAPALRLLRSRWPVHDIWAYNTYKDRPKPRTVAQDVLVTRPDYDPAPHLLPPGGAAFIDALQSGRPLGAAVEAATQAQADFDPAPVLTLLLTERAIVSLS